MATHTVSDMQQSPKSTKGSSLSSKSQDDEKRNSLDNPSEVDLIVSAPTNGVNRSELFAKHISRKQRVAIYGSFCVLSFVLSLDQYTGYTYLSTATSRSFEAHSALAAINVVRAVFQSVAQPPIAKISDILGRKEGYVIALVLYVVGYIIVASSPDIYAYGVGNSIYVLGITGLYLLQAIIIADISSLRNRLFWSIFPSIPGTINVWMAGTIASKFLLANDSAPNNWRWAIGMSAILVPFCSIPIIATLWYGERKAMRTVTVVPHVTIQSEKFHEEGVIATAEPPKMSWQARWIDYFHQLDVIGLLLLIVGAAMVLITISTANGGTNKWSDAQSIVLLVFGALFTISFVLWEKYGARFPIIPFFLLSNRTVVAAFFIALLFPCASGIASNYFYTFLVVSANQSVESATRIMGLSIFSSILTCAATGILVRYTRYLKPLILIGFCINILGLGLMIRFRSTDNSQGELAMSQVIRGIGVGMVGFPVQAAVQSMTKHKHVAVITSSYLAIFYLSGGIGSSIGGAIWTNSLLKRLEEYLGDPVLAASICANPFGYVLENTDMASFERLAISRAYNEVQRLLCITATSLAAVAFIAAMFIHNVRLTDEQSLDDDVLDDMKSSKDLP